MGQMQTSCWASSHCRYEPAAQAFLKQHRLRNWPETGTPCFSLKMSLKHRRRSMGAHQVRPLNSGTDSHLLLTLLMCYNNICAK